MLIGYARVSTDDQILDLQTNALKSAGCKKIITDTISGAKADRPGLEQVLNMLREGDTLVVWRLDRLSRSLKNLIEVVEKLDRDGIQFKSLTESIDTTTPNGKLIFHLFGAFAEFERNIIRERTNAGLAAARSRGRVGGRKKALNPKQQEMAVEMYRAKNHPIKDILDIFGISKPALYRYVKATEEARLSNP